MNNDARAAAGKVTVGLASHGQSLQTSAV